jgi:hypothetical protein
MCGGGVGQALKKASRGWTREGWPLGTGTPLFFISPLFAKRFTLKKLEET